MNSYNLEIPVPLSYFAALKAGQMQSKTLAISPLAHIQKATDATTMESTERKYDAYSIYTPNQLKFFKEEGSTFTFQSENGVALEVRVLSTTIFRVRYAPQGKFERDFSYAIDPKFKATPTIIEVIESPYAYALKTSALRFIVSKDDLRITIYNSQHQLISSEIEPYRAISTLLHGMSEVRISKFAPEQEVYFGLGDKSSALNLRGQVKQNWNTDAFAYDADRDPLYRSIPFYYALNKGLSYGIFFDNSYRTHFDFAVTETNKTTFFAEGGEANYYFIYGPDLIRVASQYIGLTGQPALPPLWSLGYHQCRWSYFPDRRVREVAKAFREHQIPCDAIYLDIDYMDGYRCFTWNEDYFPDPKSLVADLQEDGFQTIVMIDPGLRVDEDYQPYQEGIKNDYFCRRTTGELMVAPVWPPACVFPDYTNVAVRDWWGKLYHELYNEQGISGFWNDMNEPAMFKVDRATFPDEVLHYYEGELTNHRKAHNIYGFQMSRATTEGLMQLKPEKRPFLLTRATFSGGQRFAAVWTGDNVATWEHLHIANIQCQRLSISGFSFCGSDIGGFAGTPTGELMVRWLQLGVFHPFFRVHSIGNNIDGAAEVDNEKIAEQMRINRLDQEPWAFGEEYTQYAKTAIELRYRLLGYLYTAFWKHIRQGVPILKSLSFYDQADEITYTQEETFVFGDHLLVCPITQPSTEAGIIKNEDQEESKAEVPLTEPIKLLKEKTIYLPKGNWYNLYSKQRYEGKQFITLPVTLDHIPLFAKAGAIIPLYPVQQYVGEKKIEEVLLAAFFEEGEHNSQLYEDAGEDYSYKNGNYNLKLFTLLGSSSACEIRRSSEGNFAESQGTYCIRLYGLLFQARSCWMDDKQIDFLQDETRLEITVSSNFLRLFIN